jgi:hypothetical protein
MQIVNVYLQKQTKYLKMAILHSWAKYFYNLLMTKIQKGKILLDTDLGTELNHWKQLN